MLHHKWKFVDLAVQANPPNVIGQFGAKEGRDVMYLNMYLDHLVCVYMILLECRDNGCYYSSYCQVVVCVTVIVLKLCVRL